MTGAADPYAQVVEAARDKHRPLFTGALGREH